MYCIQWYTYKNTMEIQKIVKQSTNKLKSVKRRAQRKETNERQENLDKSSQHENEQKREIRNAVSIIETNNVRRN